MPNNWKTYKLEDICSIKSGKRLPKGHSLTPIKTDYPYIKTYKVTTAQEMYNKCTELFHTKDIAILSAAVADFK